MRSPGKQLFWDRAIRLDMSHLLLEISTLILQFLDSLVTLIKKKTKVLLFALIMIIFVIYRKSTALYIRCSLFGRIVLKSVLGGQMLQFRLSQKDYTHLIRNVCLHCILLQSCTKSKTFTFHESLFCLVMFYVNIIIFAITFTTCSFNFHLNYTETSA